MLRTEACYVSEQPVQGHPIRRVNMRVSAWARRAYFWHFWDTMLPCSADAGGALGGNEVNLVPQAYTAHAAKSHRHAQNQFAERRSSGSGIGRLVLKCCSAMECIDLLVCLLFVVGNDGVIAKSAQPFGTRMSTIVRC